MPRPEFSTPIHPSHNSPSSLSGSKCGSSWAMDFQVRAPYKSVDNYSDVLPAIFTDIEFGSDNAEDSFPLASSHQMKAALKKAIKGAKEILDDYDDDGYIDATNKNAINLLITRAEKYADQAQTLWDWWDEQFQPDPENPAYGWSLEYDKMPPCIEWAPAKASIIVNTIGGGQTEIEFTCPSQSQRSLHEGDRDVYATLIRAAVVNIRCAQETASAVGIYNRNIEVYESATSGGMQLSSAPATVDPGTQLSSVAPVAGGTEPGDESEDDPEDEHGDESDGDSDTFLDDEPTTPKKKKKGGGLLLIGVAGLGLLMMGKK